MTDDAFEARLREHFARRVPSEASPRLRDRVAAVPIAPNAAMTRPWLRLATWAVATVAIGLGVVRIALIDRGHGTVPVGGPTPPPTGPLFLGPGDGVTTPSVDLAFWVLAAAVVAVLAVLARLLVSHRLTRWAEYVVILVLTLTVAGVLGRATTGAGLVDQGSWAPGPTWVEIADPPADGNLPDRGGLFMPGPNGSFAFSLPVTNEGALPVTIHGLAVDPAESDSLGPHYVALGSPEPGQTWTGALVPGPDGVAPWRPMTLWPGETAVLSVLVEAGPCALAAGDTAVDRASVLESIPLVVDLAGFGYVEDVPIVGVQVAGADPCSSP